MNSRAKKVDYSNMALEVVKLQNVLLFPSTDTNFSIAAEVTFELQASKPRGEWGFDTTRYIHRSNHGCKYSNKVRPPSRAPRT